MISGLGGQDGSYLAELLLAKGHRVVGAVRDVQRTLRTLPGDLASHVELVEWDLTDQSRMFHALERYGPSDFYNLAALSSGVGMFDDPVKMGDLNGLAVARTLDAVIRVNPRIRFLQASSSEMFGRATRSPQSEQTGFRPRSPYGAAKVFAHTMVQNRRERDGLFACSAILFNHESPRRGEGFVTRKVSQGAARIKLGLSRELQIGSLDARRDWGYAPDFVRAMWLMLEQQSADDYVLATGVTRTVRQLCDAAFAAVDLDYREFVRERPEDLRPVEAIPLAGDASRARARLGWHPEVGFEEWVQLMVASDLRILGEQVGARSSSHVRND